MLILLSCAWIKWTFTFTSVFKNLHFRPSTLRRQTTVFKNLHPGESFRKPLFFMTYSSVFDCNSVDRRWKRTKKHALVGMDPNYKLRSHKIILSAFCGTVHCSFKPCPHESIFCGTFFVTHFLAGFSQNPLAHFLWRVVHRSTGILNVMYYCMPQKVRTLVSLHTTCERESCHNFLYTRIKELCQKICSCWRVLMIKKIIANYFF